MLDFSRTKISVIIFICLLFIWLALPNLLPDSIKKKIPENILGSEISLGLDLRGGSHLLLEIDFASYIKEQYENLRADIRAQLLEDKIGYRSVRVRGSSVVISLLKDKLPEDFSIYNFLKKVDDGLDYTEDGDIITVRFSEKSLAEKRQNVMEQSIEMVNRRINETGLVEPTIQRQGDNRILLQVPGLEDPERLKEILGRTAKMTFHLVNEEASALDMLNKTPPLGTRIVPGDKNDLLPNGEVRKYAIYSKVELSGELLTNAGLSYNNGQPVVSFRFNNVGAKKFGDITRKNVGKRFAIVLDGKVITAPVINGPILGGSGIITFPPDIDRARQEREVADLALLLRAGALPAPLKVVEERTVGPSLGADSIKAGKNAAFIAIIAVMIFMTISYGLFGIFSNIALIVNMLILLGVLSLFQATLTLPGIAGIVLTLGMAVDANVLIFERIREEIARGRSAMASLDSGFRSAFATIVDSNITTLIAAFVLYIFGTGTIKGFAITLSFGILSSMFSAILLTRMMVAIWARKRRPQTIPI